MTRVQRWAPFAPYAVIGLAHLVMLLIPGGVDANVTKLMLMPALLVGVVVALRARPSAALLVGSVGILFSWAGDALLESPGDVNFLIGLGLFLLAHLAYLALFLRPLRERRIPRYAAAYALWWLVLVVYLAPFVGSLLVPVAIYGLAVAASAVTALAATRPAGLGALLFLTSDSILAFKLFVGGSDIVGIDALIMALYIAGQGFIAVAVVNRASRSQSRPVQ